MKPKLVLLNGNPGMGKTTLAQMYIDHHPMALNLDIDRLWHMMGQWQESRPHSEKQKRKLAYAVADTHLVDGFDVVIADHVQDASVYERFEKIAITNGANFKEVVLVSNIDDAIQRCKNRAVRLGYPDGFRPGGVLDSNGREAMLESMYLGMLATVNARPNTIYIESVEGEIDGTYQKLIKAIE